MKEMLLKIYSTVSFKLLSILGYLILLLLLYVVHATDGYGAGMGVVFIILLNIIISPILIIIGCIEYKRKQIDNKVKNIVLMIFFYIGISIYTFFTFCILMAFIS